MIMSAVALFTPTFHLRLVPGVFFFFSYHAQFFYSNLLKFLSVLKCPRFWILELSLASSIIQLRPVSLHDIIQFWIQKGKRYRLYLQILSDYYDSWQYIHDGTEVEITFCLLILFFVYLLFQKVLLITVFAVSNRLMYFSHSNITRHGKTMKCYSRAR